MSLALLFHYLTLNMFQMLIHPFSGVCDLFVELFQWLYCSGTMCVGFTLWFGWGGMVSGCRLHLRSLRLICWVISWDVLLWYDVCWCYVVVWLGWCGILMQAEALLPHLDVTCFFSSLFNAQHVSDVNTSILRSLRLICWVISWIVLLWYDVCWCYGVVWLGWCGVVSVRRLKH